VKINLIAIIGDARKVLKKLPSNFFQLVVTSPPYFNLKNYNKSFEEGNLGAINNFEVFIEEINKVWKECFRILKPDGKLAINASDIFKKERVMGKDVQVRVPINERFVIECIKMGFLYRAKIIWYKHASTGEDKCTGTFPYPYNLLFWDASFEEINIFKKPGNYQKRPKEIEEMSKITKEEYVENAKPIWEIPPVRQKGHCAMFPVELPMRLIKHFTFVQDWVLDPFGGSGTTLLACKKMKRNGVIVELNEEYLPLIKEKVGWGQQAIGVRYEYKIIFEDELDDFQEVPRKL